TAQLNQKIFEDELRKMNLVKEKRGLLAAIDIKANSVTSIEIDEQGNKIVLFEKNSAGIFPIASLTKLMTALVVFDLKGTYKPSQLITISREAVLQKGQSKYGELVVGEKLSVEALLHIMLIESSNDAAFALTQPIGEEAFVSLMNIYTKNLELQNTNFINSTGLDPDNNQGISNYSTGQDIVKIIEYILTNHPQIMEITLKQSYEVLKPNGSLHHFIPQSTNELLSEIPEIIGGKTGWTIEANGCLLLVLDNSKGGYFINIVLGSEDRFGDMRKIIKALTGTGSL
ncbi:MAG: D-alanyl-D-alanine carboxypeptidase, partial [Candidatus Nealsonbacteria bacterium]|nr:D-alanyl-D-alanine carboxypeptidase [Candidatus Nealsonbacteria bacterium]